MSTVCPQDREVHEVSSLWKVMHELLDWRRQLVTGTLTQDQTRELRVKVTAKIDWGNRSVRADGRTSDVRRATADPWMTQIRGSVHRHRSAPLTYAVHAREMISVILTYVGRLN